MTDPFSQTPRKASWHEPFIDNRGLFSRAFDADLDTQIKQVNVSHTRIAGTIRGFHFLASGDEGKFIRVLSGRIWDVSFNTQESRIPPEMFTFELGVSDGAIFIPPNYAHAFQTLAPDTTVLYGVTAPYNKEFDRTINPLSPNLQIVWPLAVSLLSTKDNLAPEWPEN